MPALNAGDPAILQESAPVIKRETEEPEETETVLIPLAADDSMIEEMIDETIEETTDEMIDTVMIVVVLLEETQTEKMIEDVMTEEIAKEIEAEMIDEIEIEMNDEAAGNEIEKIESTDDEMTKMIVTIEEKEEIKIDLSPPQRIETHLNHLELMIVTVTEIEITAILPNHHPS